MKKRALLSLLLACVTAFAAFAGDGDFPRHEFRIGWGDMRFEKAVFRAGTSKQHYRYFGHVFANYQYSILNWLSAGMQVDYENVTWNVLAERGVVLPKPDINHCFYNLCFMPTARFTYYRKGMVTMYSALYGGLLVNGGTETDNKGRKTACAPVFGLTAYAVSVGDDHWFGTFELGGLNSIVSKGEIYMVGSRLVTLSVGYRF